MSTPPMPGVEFRPSPERRSENPTAPRPSERPTSAREPRERPPSARESAPEAERPFRERLAQRGVAEKSPAGEQPDHDHVATPTPAAAKPPVPGSELLGAEIRLLDDQLLPESLAPILATFAERVAGAEDLDLDQLDAITPLLAPVVVPADLTAVSPASIAGGDEQAPAVVAANPVPVLATPTAGQVTGQIAPVTTGEAATPLASNERPTLKALGPNSPASLDPAHADPATKVPQIGMEVATEASEDGDQQPGSNAQRSASILPPTITASTNEQSEDFAPQLQSAVRGAAEISSLAENKRGDLTAAQLTRATEANAADRAVTNQISRAVIQQLADGQRVLNLRLTPPELGTVRVQVIEHNGQLSVRFSAEDDGVRVAIERALPQMRQDLRASDAPIADLQLVDDQGFERQDAREQQGERRQGGDRHGADGEVFSLDGLPPERRRSRAPVQLGGRIADDLVDARA